MPRLLTNLKFWAVTLSLVWILAIVTVISLNPGFSHGMK
jgi:hypothetical protein